MFDIVCFWFATKYTHLPFFDWKAMPMQAYSRQQMNNSNWMLATKILLMIFSIEWCCLIFCLDENNSVDCLFRCLHSIPIVECFRHMIFVSIFLASWVHSWTSWTETEVLTNKHFKLNFVFFNLNRSYCSEVFFVILVLKDWIQKKYNYNINKCHSFTNVTVIILFI